jgi:hypothetical protein
VEVGGFADEFIIVSRQLDNLKILCSELDSAPGRTLETILRPSLVGVLKESLATFKADHHAERLAYLRLVTSIHEFLKLAATEGLDDAEPVTSATQREATSLLTNTADRSTLLVLEAEALKAAYKAHDFAKQAEGALNDALDAAGATADARLGREFSDYAREETARQKTWEYRAAFGLALLLSLSAWLVFRTPSIDWRQEVAKVLVGLPLAVFVAYSIRAATRHRHVSEWSRAASIRIQTARAFTDGLSDEVRNEVMLAVARDVLGSPPINTNSANLSSNPTSPDLLTLLEQAASAMRRATSRN